MWTDRSARVRASLLTAAMLATAPMAAVAQTLSSLQGRVFDASGAVLADGVIRVENTATGLDVSIRADAEGRYYIPALLAGTYIVSAEAPGFRTERIEALNVDAGRAIVRHFHLEIAATTEMVRVDAEVPLVDRATSAVMHLVTGGTVQQAPVNGRHFTDLALLVPGSVAPSQAGFSARPIRGIGALAFNTGGAREEAVAFLVNGVSTNNLTFGSLMFEPPLASIDQFSVSNSTFGAEHGHVSGAVVNIVTRSGTDQFRGELFEFLRNDAFDARNFFEFTSPQPHPFKRNQFGGSIGGPIRRGRTFFFASYEGLRQHQGVDVNSLVLSDEQRAAASNSVVRQLLPLIPRANFFDAAGTPRFVSSAPAIADTDRWTIDVQHHAGTRDRMQVFYGHQQVHSREPGAQGNSIPGFGSVYRPMMSVLTAVETHVARSSSTVNEARFGRSRLNGGTFPATPLNPADFGIHNGVTRSIGLPQLIVAGDLNFGGPGPLPQGRFDTSYVVSDTVTSVRGRHTTKAGGEYRHFINDNFAEGTGVFNFPTVDAFLVGEANAFTATLGRRNTVIDQHAAGLFLQHTVMVGDALTLEFGVRYEWHVTPAERNDRFVVFDAATASLLRVGIDRKRIYEQNNRNVEPRFGAAWNLSPGGRTVLRAAYARAADEPVTTAVRDTAGNPPFAVPLTAAGIIPIDAALDTTRPAGLAPATVDPRYRNATAQSWNVNLQRQVAADMAVTVGYSSSHGSNLRISRNLNQPVDGVRPFASLSPSSPIEPGAALGNITQVESTGFSNYNALWTAVTRRLSRGVQVDASYTWSKSLDTNSLNSSAFAIQDSYNIAGQYGLSDFDARHRFVLTAIYQSPFRTYAIARGWQLAAVVQAQRGNPVNIVTSNSSLNGAPNTVRPDVTGPVRVIGSVDRWFDPAVFVAANHFGNLGRNVVIGPRFVNTDLALARTVGGGSRPGLQFRVDAFDVFNHANFGPPGNIVGSPTFARITRTRLPTGEAGSSRQIQLSAKVSF